jgi:hypothetical protein
MSLILKQRGKPDLSCQSKFIAIDFSQQIISDTFEYALSHMEPVFGNITGSKG